MDFRTLLNQIATFFQHLSLRQRIVMAISILVVVGFLVFLSLYSGSKKPSFAGYGVLFENTSPSDSALIIQQLEQTGVPYQVYNEGTIMVPTDLVYKTRISVAALGIPKNSKVGFEIFDKQEFGATDFEQRVKYLRALEGELSRTIEGLMPINKATVRVAIPKESVFTERQSEPTASIVLDINPSMSLGLKQIVGIKNLVAASVMKLTPKNVKIVNQDGVPLGEEDGAFENDMIKNQMMYQKDYEVDYEKKIRNVLAPIVGGKNKVVANVTIDFDFAREDSTSEVYDPNSVPRSEQSVEEKREGMKPAEVGGVPGAVSNIGPVQGLEEDKVTEKYVKNSATTNYEISKKITKTQDAFATIKRVSAAVVVDGKYEYVKDENGEPTEELAYVPLTEDELNRINAVVKQTIGFKADRGDQVTVSNFEFKPLQDEIRLTATQTIVTKVTSYLNPIWPIIKYLLVFLLLFIFYKKVIVPFSEHMIATATETEEEPIMEDMPEIEESAEDTLEKFQKARKKVEEQLGVSKDFNEEELRYEVLLEKIKDVANERGEEVAGLIQNMIKSESDYSSNLKD